MRPTAEARLTCDERNVIDRAAVLAKQGYVIELFDRPGTGGQRQICYMAKGTSLVEVVGRSASSLAPAKLQLAKDEFLRIAAQKGLLVGG